jgi:ADP-heptose:LPS heptosyltransferase
VLSNKDKQIKLVVTEKDVEELKKTIGIDDLKNLVLVHPGRGWASKTFPSEYWSEIIKGVSENHRVAVIGKSISKEQGLVDVDCEGVIDLRNLLNLRELITLISQAKLLISNDSAPVHIAGAFDNWIFLIPSCKHPDHILPYREGGQYHKAKVFYKRLTCDDINSTPTNLDGAGVDIISTGNILDYLEDPKVIVQAVDTRNSNKEIL